MDAGFRLLFESKKLSKSFPLKGHTDRKKKKSPGSVDAHILMKLLQPAPQRDIQFTIHESL